jgi:hypothetical protein
MTIQSNSENNGVAASGRGMTLGYVVAVLLILMGLSYLLLLRFDYFDFFYESFTHRPTFARPGGGDFVRFWNKLEMQASILLGLGLCVSGLMMFLRNDVGRKLGIVFSIFAAVASLVMSFPAIDLIRSVNPHNIVSVRHLAIGYPVCLVVSIGALVYFFTSGRHFGRSGGMASWIVAIGILAIAEILMVL